LLSRFCARLLRSPSLPPFLAAMLASPSILIEPAGSRRLTIVFYALTRGLQGGWDGLVLNGHVPRAMREGRWWWGGHLLFAGANALLLHSFVYNPNVFPASYSKFILNYSTRYLPTKPSSYPASMIWPSARDAVDALRIVSQSAKPYPNFVSPALHPSARLPALLVAPVLAETHPLHTRLTCAFLHPNEPSCKAVFSSFVRQQMAAAAPFFAALGLISASRESCHD
jgi:hypothetical protein